MTQSHWHYLLSNKIKMFPETLKTVEEYGLWNCFQKNHIKVIFYYSVSYLDLCWNGRKERSENKWCGISVVYSVKSLWSEWLDEKKKKEKALFQHYMCRPWATIAWIINIFFAAGSREESLLAEKSGVYYIARNTRENQILKIRILTARALWITALGFSVRTEK